MAKLKNIIKQLSQPDYQNIFDQLLNSNAEKSAFLLKFIRERQMSDAKVMEELDVNNNAYYTLRSRLNQKIEEYLLQQMENPRTDLLKKVANINEIIFSKKRAIAVATLKKLEKELLDYDLSNELTVVYKTLKKLHINHPDHFNYSQQYNRHVAYMLAMDKVEDLINEYFKKFGVYTMTGGEIEKMGLGILHTEITNVANLYKSHRLYIYHSCVNIFHRLFVENLEDTNPDEEPIEDVLEKAEKIFEQYSRDSIYYNLKPVFEFLKFEYYNSIHQYRKAERFYEELSDDIAILVSNYGMFTYTPQLLLSKVDRHLRMDSEHLLYEENKAIFMDYDPDLNDVPKHITYVLYRALSCFFADKFEESARYINNMLNELSLKKYPQAQTEVKLLLALQYCLQSDYDLFNQCVNSIQRQVRIGNKENADHVVLFIKAMKVSLGEGKKTKAEKIKSLFDKIKQVQITHFSVIPHIRLDDRLIDKMV